MHASLILTYDTDLHVLQQRLLDTVKVNQHAKHAGHSLFES